MKQLIFIFSFFLFFSCSTNSKKLDSNVQEINLNYITWACECANWATLDDIEKYSDSQDKLAESCFFIEPADSTLILPDTLGYNNDRIQFTGQFYLEKGFPENYIKSAQKVDRARVFRYTSFKVIKSNYSESIANSIDSSKYLIDKGDLIGQSKTIDLSYAAIMCTCPQWFETKYTNGTEYYYLEPANEKLVSANKLYDGTNIPLLISVTGNFYSNKGYPKK